MKIEVKNRSASLVDWDTLMQNSKEVHTVEFAFDDTWEGFAKTAVFAAGLVSISVALAEDKCAVPPQCLAWGGVVLRVGVYGEKGAERKQTSWCRAGKVLHEAFGGSSSPSASDPDLSEEVLAVIGDLSAAGFHGGTLVDALCEVRDSVSKTATDEEVEAMLNGTFGSQSESVPEDESPDSTATDQEVDDLLDDVFG